MKMTTCTPAQHIQVKDALGVQWLMNPDTQLKSKRPEDAKAFSTVEAQKVFKELTRLGFKGLSIVDELPNDRKMKMKRYTVGDGYAIMILASQRMGLGPMHVDDAKRQLNGGVIHPMTGASMSKAACELNDRLRHDATLIAKANIHAEQLMAEYGFTVDISKDAFLALQEEAEGLEMAHAKGQDLPWHSERLNVIDKIMNNAQWTLHPDFGCVLKSEVNARERAAAMQP